MSLYQKRGKKKAFDEFYTPYEQVESFLGELRDSGQFKGIKTICCPCDGADSNIVKWLQNNTKAKIVYFDYLDCNSTRARQQMLKCGCVITNPPFNFKAWGPLYQFLVKNNLKYCIWGTFLQSGHFRYIDRFDCVRKSRETVETFFERPDGSTSGVCVLLYSNFDFKEEPYEYKAPEKEQFYEGIPVFDFIANIPKDYYGWFYAPVTALWYVKNRDYDKERSIRGVPGKYTRVCIRRRKEDGNT